MSITTEDLLRSIREDEKRIKQLREAAPNIVLQSVENRQQIIQLIRKLTKSYDTLIVKHMDHCDENSISHLWKTCFYKQIEDFRGALKQIKAAADGASAEKNRSSEAPKFKQLLASSQSMFIEFLNMAKSFFQKLIEKLEAAATVTDTTNTTRLELLTKYVYKCLIFLGDLARYKELYSAKDKKDYIDSLKFYEKASLLMPDIGNAHNQLAVLATYSETLSTALYHYCRSIMTKAPFSGGFTNIAQLFDTNLPIHENFQLMRRNGVDLDGPNGDITRFKMFLSGFVHLQGVFFAWSVRMHLDYLRTVNAQVTTQSQSSGESTTVLSKLNDSLSVRILRNERDLKPEKLRQMTATLLEDFEWLINENKLSNLHILRTVVICIFAIHFAEMPDAALLSTNDASFSQFLQSTYDSQLTTDALLPAAGTITSAAGDEEMGKVERTMVQSLMLSLLYKMVHKTALKLTQSSSAAGDRNNSVNKQGGDRCQSLVLIFLLWLEQHPVHLRPPEEVEVEDIALPAVFSDSLSLDDSNLPLQQWKRRYCVDAVQAKYEQQTRSQLRGSMSLLQDYLSQQTFVTSKSTVATTATANAESSSVRFMIRDIAEMRGFLPLGEAVEQYFTGFHALKQSLQWYSPQKTKEESSRIIYHTIQTLFPDISSSSSSSTAEQTRRAGGGAHSATSAGPSVGANVSNVRSRQLFDPHADTKSSRHISASSSAAATGSTNANKKEPNASISKKKEVAKKGSPEIEQRAGIDKKRAKLHENQPRDLTSSYSANTAANDNYNDENEQDIGPESNKASNTAETGTKTKAEEKAVEIKAFSAGQYSFFGNMSGGVADGVPLQEEEELGQFLDEDNTAEDNSFELLNQSISSEIGASEFLHGSLVSSVPSLTEHIMRHSGAASVGSTSSPFGFPSSSRGSLSANPSQDRLTAMLSPNGSMSNLHRYSLTAGNNVGTGASAEGIDDSATGASALFLTGNTPHHNHQMNYNNTVESYTREEDEDDFEDVVFRPAFPKADLSQPTSANVLSGTISDVPSVNRTNIWAQFGIDSNTSLIHNQEMLDRSYAQQSSAAVLSESVIPSQHHSLFPSPMHHLYDHPLGNNHGSLVGAGWEPSEHLLGLTSSSSASLPTSSAALLTAGWGESTGHSLFVGTGLSATSTVLPAAASAAAATSSTSAGSNRPIPPPPGLFSPPANQSHDDSNNSATTKTAAGPPPGLRSNNGGHTNAPTTIAPAMGGTAGGSGPPGLASSSSGTSVGQKRSGESFLAYLAQGGQHGHIGSGHSSGTWNT